MTQTQYADKADAQVSAASHVSDPLADTDEIARLARIAPSTARPQKCHTPLLSLSKRLAPAAECLLRLVEDDTLPCLAVEQIATALLILADVAEDDELGLISATPEARVAALLSGEPVEGITVIAFDEALLTPYVQAIYADEIKAVRLAALENKKPQLVRSAYALARIVAAGALPLDHVRHSLTQAARSLPADIVTSTIDAAIRRGLCNPRILPEPRHYP